MKKIGMMIDVARNAVRSVETIKQSIDISKKCNMNTLYLYLEDCFEVNNEPYFGYMRGRYTKEELKDIDNYAFNKGIEVVPCIQTLAHLNQIFRWKEYLAINDVNDILLTDNERTYTLIDNMFQTIKECFRSNRVNISMDEAHMLGKGAYLKTHSFTKPDEIFYHHLLKVHSMANKYGFNLLMWSDMFFRASNKDSEYYDTKTKFSSDVIKNTPNDISLIYWDYYHVDKAFYKSMFKAHRMLNNPLAFACGIWSWTGFVSSNKFAISTIKPGISAAIEENVDEIMITMWGDNGAECPLFASLPSTYYAACLANGISSINDIKNGFYDTFKIKYDDFMKLDLPNILDKKYIHVNPSKYLLYNDPFIGMYDSSLNEGETLIYAKYARTLNSLVNKFNSFSYIPKMYASLCKTLFYKAELGLKTRKAYQNKENLDSVIKDYDLSIKFLKVFIKDFRDAWFKENKPHGFEIEEIRLGGLLERLISCKNRLVSYVKGEIKSIPELEETILDLDGLSKDKIRKEPELINCYKDNASVNNF